MYAPMHREAITLPSSKLEVSVDDAMGGIEVACDPSVSGTAWIRLAPEGDATPERALDARVTVTRGRGTVEPLPPGTNTISVELPDRTGGRVDDVVVKVGAATPVAIDPGSIGVRGQCLEASSGLAIAASVKLWTLSGSVV